MESERKCDCARIWPSSGGAAQTPSGSENTEKTCRWRFRVLQGRFPPVGFEKPEFDPDSFKNVAIGHGVPDPLHGLQGINVLDLRVGSLMGGTFRAYALWTPPI